MPILRKIAVHTGVLGAIEGLDQARVNAASQHTEAPQSELLTHRALALAAAMCLLMPADLAWSAMALSPVVATLGATLSGVAILMLWLAASTRSLARIERLDWWILAAAIAAVILAQAAASRGSAYQSDEAALIHAGALRLLHGHDPYGANLSWAFAHYGLSGRVPLTYLMNGGTVHTLGYPAFPVLAALPIVALSQHAAALTIAAAAGLCVGMAVAFMLLPKQLRLLSVIVCAGGAGLISLVSDGLPSILMLGPLTVCAYRWASVGMLREDGRPKLGTGGSLRAVCLGLAIATNQLAWFLAPFLLVGTFLSSKQRVGPAAARRIAMRYLAVAVTTFVVVNAPFIVWGPHQWLAGVAAPITQHAIPWGQGLVGLTAFAGIGGGAMSFYSYGSALLYLALLGIFWMRFEILGRCLLLLPLVALYTSSRSLESYWLAPIAVVIVSVVCSGLPEPMAQEAAATTRGTVSRQRLPGVLRYGLLIVPALICFVIALGTPGPLTLQVVGSRSNAGRAVSELIVSAANTSGNTVVPHFAINNTGTIAALWHVVRGPAKLRAGTKARYVLQAPNATSEPPAGTSYVLQAISDNPQAISTGPLTSAPGAP